MNITLNLASGHAVTVKLTSDIAAGLAAAGIGTSHKAPPPTVDWTKRPLGILESDPKRFRALGLSGAQIKRLFEVLHSRGKCMIAHKTAIECGFSVDPKQVDPKQGPKGHMLLDECVCHLTAHIRKRSSKRYE